MLLIAIAYFTTALLYASVGFGGGSTYSAILALANTDYHLIPLVSLSCNIVVVTGGMWHFYRCGYLQARKILPWIVSSIPASFLGGLIPVPEIWFLGLLGFALFFSGVRLLWPGAKNAETSIRDNSIHPVIPAISGSGLGLLAGITGIGGGIFLAPVLYFLKWGTAKQIAATCSVFIFVNSIAGITGQIFKLGGVDAISLAKPYWLLIPAVLVGGQIGSWMGSSRMGTTIVRKMTAILILYVAIRLLIRTAFML